MAAFAPPEKPLGVIEAVAGGFELVTQRPYLILLPVFLDLFLWLGPRLSIAPMVERLLSSNLLQPPAGMDEGMYRSVLASWETIGANYNAFAALCTAPLGVPSLILGPVAMPFGLNTAGPLTPAPESVAAVFPVLTLENGLVFLGSLLIFSLVGFGLGMVYLTVIARQVAPNETSMVGHVLRSLLHLGFFAAGVVGFLAVVLIPFSLVLNLLALLSSALASFAALFAFVILLWVGLFVAFVPHGVILGERSIFSAIWGSITLVQWNMPSVLGLFVLFFGIQIGLFVIFTLPAAGSWLLLLSIVGHGFTATGLIAGTYVFYHDRSRWWQENRQWILGQLAEQRRRAEFNRKTKPEINLEPKDDDTPEG